jgi:hypothetical protein
MPAASDGVMVKERACKPVDVEVDEFSVQWAFRHGNVPLRSVQLNRSAKSYSNA